MQRLRVAVIGAGAAGLVALRHLRDHLDTFQPVAFEQTQQIGGTWVYSDEVGIDSSTGRPVHSSMYRHLRVNLPKEVPPLILKSVMVVRILLYYCRCTAVLLHDLLLRSFLYYCVWSVITAHNLTPEKRDNNLVVGVCNVYLNTL